MSINTKTIPLNPAGALELGMNPCDACDMGWYIHSTDSSSSCADTCIYWKKHCKGNQVK